MTWMTALPFVARSASLLWIVGQTQTDALAGSAGWVGTGLLGAVLSWMFFVHLPAKDKQLKEKDQIHESTVLRATESHKGVVKDLQTEFRAALKEVADAHKSALGLVIEHCRSENAGILLAIHKDFELLFTRMNHKPMV